MKIRMKISYQALLNGMTIEEHIFSAILKSFKQLTQSGQLSHKFANFDPVVLKKLLAGRADVKMVAWHKMKLMSKNE